MNILIYGSKGWIGNQFKKILEEKNINYIEGKSRVDDELKLEKELTKINPSHIISFIGRTHGKIGDKEYSTIDYLEEKGKILENVRDNLFSPLILADICRKRDIHFTYLGTGCIFTFDETHPYEEEINGFTEESMPNFFGSGYSTVKGFTDRLMKLYSGTALTLRIRMPITGEKNPRNFITKITNYKNICSIKNSMTVLPELLPFIVKLMKDKTVGTLNFTNPGLISHNEILEMYKEIVDPEFTWQNFSKEEQSKILTSDRSNNYLDTTRLETLFPEVLNIKDSVRKVLYEYKNLGWNINISLHTGLDLLINEKVVLIMAGGLGKRMNSELPKVLHLLKEKPLIVHVIETALKINPIKIGIIVGKYRNIIEMTINKYLKDTSKIDYIIQPDALGTGDAIMCCKDFLSNYKNSSVTILSGDVPLIKSETLERLNTSLNKSLAAILINKLDNPAGYGRIIRDNKQFVKIVEEKDCNKEERKVDIVNSGIYSFKTETILNNISKITNNNKQNEYYLTDIFNFINKKSIDLLYLENKYEVMGVNTPEQLKELENTDSF